MSNNIKDAHRNAIGCIVEAAKEDRLALFEVTDAAGKPAILLVAAEHDSKGKGGLIAPLARIDVDFAAEFTPPEGVETVAPEDDQCSGCQEIETDKDGICEGCSRCSLCECTCGLETFSDEGLDNAGEGC